MSKPKTKQEILAIRMAENEVAFRNLNRRLLLGFNELLRIAKEENQEALVDIPRGLLSFQCECADAKCRRRIKMTLKTWDRIHRNPCKFSVYPNHWVPGIEKAVKGNSRYQVVEKFDCPNQEAHHLWRVPVHFA